MVSAQFSVSRKILEESFVSSQLVCFDQHVHRIHDLLRFDYQILHSKIEPYQFMS